MAAIKNRDTKPELIIRRLLHKQGFRYTLNNRHLPGNPDLVLPKFQAVIFVHGCFWHKHECYLFKWPQTRAKFWREKILSNEKNDQNKQMILRDSGWRIAVIWECAVKSQNLVKANRISRQLRNWLNSEKLTIEISG